QDPDALPPGGGGEPARKSGRIADSVQLVHQAQPDALADIVGIGAAEPVPAADRPDQRGVPLHERVPRLLVAVSGAGYQVNDHRIIGHLVSVPSRGCTRGSAADVLTVPALHRDVCHPSTGTRPGLYQGVGSLSGHDLVLLMS